MGRLRADKTGASFPLLARTLIGRSPSCSVRIGDGVASGEHALLSYTGAGWELRDLGSKNGTYVDGERLEPGRSVAVHEGAKLGFGTKEGFELVEAGPPPLLAIDLASAEVITAADGVLVLPSEETPLVSVYESGRGEIMIESEAGPLRKLVEAEVISVGGRVFRVEPPDVPEGTPFVGEGPTIDNVTFRFKVSRNQDYVDLVVLHRERQIEIARREHLYVLMHLAKLRLEDAEQPIEERGWVDREALLQMLAMETNALDVAIHRARRQLAQAGIERAAGIVEVRPGQRRFCTDRIEIV